jgi:hypothetical protein
LLENWLREADDVDALAKRVRFLLEGVFCVLNGRAKDCGVFRRVELCEFVEAV